MSDTAASTAQQEGQKGKKWYEAACHCHAVEYRVLLGDMYGGGDGVEEEVCECNCSICTKNGYLLVYPLRADVVFTRGGLDSLRGYRFATKLNNHKFCPDCGSSMLIDFEGKTDRLDFGGGPPQDVLALNARMIKDIDLKRLHKQASNGRDELSPEFNEATA